MDFFKGFTECWWPGPTCHVDWSALSGMTQAILSALAIMAAWALQSRQHRLEILQRSDAIVELLRQLADIGKAAHEFTKALKGTTAFAELDRVLLTALMQAVDEIPVHELPIAALTTPVVRARRSARQLETNIAEASRIASQLQQGIGAAHAHNIFENCNELATAYAEAVVAHNARVGCWVWGLADFRRHVRTTAPANE